ncbi:hypothetical protein [Microtetraspora malaysiensis]|uniref:hypothetical protein n=1 Tax=Microtetraspora malaysiensis TaxID=161358 RepID=UPI0012F8287F|nr:hypothetical protein [Microtetraspora malaysiensis]
MSLRRGSVREAEKNDAPSRPRTPYYEGAEHLPAMPRRTWFRLAALLRWRGGLADECAWRMVRHLTHWADERGRLADMQAVMESYATRHRVSVRIAWADFGRLRPLGLVRQTAAPAPGRRARYVLSVPAELPAELPRTLARAVRDEIDPAASRAKGTITRAQADALLAECEVIRQGSTTGPARYTAGGCGRLHTSPYTREGSPPSPQRPDRPSLPRPHRTPYRGISDEETAAGLYLVQICGPLWAAQRGRGRGLTDAEAAEIGRLVALLLRRLPKSEVVELLTEQTGSAADLARVVRFRIGRTLATLRRRAEVPADEDGQGYAAGMAARAAAVVAQHEATTTSRHAVRRALEEARARTAARDGRDRTDSRSSTTAPPRSVAEPEEVFAATLSEPTPSRTGAGWDERAWLANAAAFARAAQHGQHQDHDDEGRPRGR